MKRILVIHGPNLNLLGKREPEIYGKMSLDQLNELIMVHGRKLGFEIHIFQSNHEGKLIDFIHDQSEYASGIVINPAAYTHYSIAIRDALAAIDLPTVEVHLSDINNREEFRRISVIKDVCLKQISGLGEKSYLDALDLLQEKLN